VDSSGEVTGIAQGSAIITVTTADGGFSATCEVNVDGKNAEQISNDVDGALAQLQSQVENLIIAFIVGFIFMFVSSALMFFTKKLEKNIKKDKSSALNKTGKAYTFFAPNGTGQIEIEINGQLSVVNAINSSDTAIDSFDSVVVTAVKDDLLYIRKV
jgi:membrane protein implicated in regulation of membrane protease activity